MEKRISLVIVTMISAVGILLAGCAPQPKAGSGQGVNSSNQVLGQTSSQPANQASRKTPNSIPTSSDLGQVEETAKAYYAAHKATIVAMKPYVSQNGLWVEYNYGDKTIPDRYDWWDIKQQTHYPIQNGTVFTNVLSVSSTHVRLLATGPNDITPGVAFPFIIDNSRSNETSDFARTDIPYYLKLTHQVKFGYGKTCTVTSILPTADGLQVTFGPVLGKENLFYAGAPGSPIMDTSYDASTRVFTIRFISSILPNHKQTMSLNFSNPFVSSGGVHTEGSDVIVDLKLKRDTAYYNAKQATVLTGKRDPYVAFHFADALPDSPYDIVFEK